MTWPERYHPIGVPTDWDEMSWFILSTAGMTALWSLKYAADVWHTIPRMASHKYANPSRRAIVRAAMRETSMLSGTRLGGMLVTSGGAIGFTLSALLIVEGAMLLGSGINYFAPTVRDSETGLSSYESYLHGSSVMDPDPSHPFASWWGTD